MCNEMGHISKYCSYKEGQSVPSSRGGAPLQYNQVVQGNIQRNSNQRVQPVHTVKQTMKVDINEKKVGVQSEKLEIILKNDANEMVRKVKKVVKRKSTEPFIVETPTKVISVDSEVRTLPSSLPTSPLHTRTPYPSSGFDPRSFSGSTPRPSSGSTPRPTSGSTPLPSSHSTPRTSPHQNTRTPPCPDTPHVLAKHVSPIPVTANPFDVLRNDLVSDGVSCVMRSTASKSKVSHEGDAMPMTPIIFTLPTDDESQHISPLPSPLEFHESSNVLQDLDMLTLHDLPVESASESIDMNESSYSLSDLNVSVHQDITLTPPTEKDIFEFFYTAQGGS